MDVLNKNLSNLYIKENNKEIHNITELWRKKGWIETYKRIYDVALDMKHWLTFYENEEIIGYLYVIENIFQELYYEYFYINWVENYKEVNEYVKLNINLLRLNIYNFLSINPEKFDNLNDIYNTFKLIINIFQLLFNINKITFD